MKKTLFSLVIASALFMPFAYAYYDGGSLDGTVIESCEEQFAGGEFGAKLIAVRRPLRVEPGEEFIVKMFLKNTGKTPWFSYDHDCLDHPVMELRSDRPADHANRFTGTSVFPMSTERVDPEEIGVFKIPMLAPEKEDIYREYFVPFVAGKFLDKTIKLDIWVGRPDIAHFQEKSEVVDYSAAFSDVKIYGEKMLEVDLSEQRLRLKTGETVLHEFPVSTGKRATPTPKGETQILLKQKVRVAGKAPYYIMPNFMMFRKGGYGFHALPSLGNAKLRARLKTLKADEDAPVEWFKNDSLWTEALDHIGTPRSHGCIRLLPEHAKILYGFADMGMKVIVHD